MALDARKAKFPPMKPLRPPKGAPNVVIILIDDMGFATSSVVGGPCNMPALQRITNDGLLYNRFHNTALCSPTRQALLTGRNHHSAEMGAVCEVATSTPGNTTVRPNSVATIAEILRLNGYSTGAVGKMHQTPVWEVSMSGPFDRWPTGDGFEKFYGFVGGETNQYVPTLYLGTSPVEPWGTAEEGYHFSEDIVDKSIAWIRGLHTMTPDKPFFLYVSFGATHAPHSVSKKYIDKYAGKFDKGWDAVREEILANMKAKGVVPQDTDLAGRPEGVVAWDELNQSQKKVYTRLMEVFAAFAEHTDDQVQRIIDTLDELGIYEDTLFIYIAGDNGGATEGGLDGTMNWMAGLNGMPMPLETTLERLDDAGSPKAYNCYPAGWAHAMNTPFQWTKQIAGHFGGTRTALALSWPKGIKAKDEIRQQFHHVIDIVPTILEAAGLPEPYMVNGVAQKPLEGVSMAYTFDNPNAEDRHVTQYFEIAGNRGIYHEGWTGVTKHRTPWVMGHQQLPKFSEDNWELYDTNKDWSQAHDLSKEMPDKLRELQELFLIEASKYNVFPLDDRAGERFNPEIAGRPDLPHGRKTMTFYPGMTHLAENTVLNIKNKSHTITAELEIPEEDASGVIIAQGGRFGGWSLYVKDGAVKYCHNCVDLYYSYVGGEKKLPSGKLNVRYHFAFDGGHPGAGGTGRIYVNDELVSEGRISKTVPFLFSADETLDVGGDLAMPVTDDYPGGKANKFNGKIHWVRVDLEDDDVSHLEPEEQKYYRIMGRQ